ncbi:MAG: glycoside hydrolase family 97 protein [Pirellulales bacterium]|nr:glycoside hydrolase family 97 protein [Pirellulales bacterium]
MRFCRFTGLLVAAVACAASLAAAQPASQAEQLESPDGRIRAIFRLGADGELGFDVKLGDAVIAQGAVGLKLANSAPMERGFKVVNVERRSRDETYSIPVGKTSTARDHHNAMIISLQEEAAPQRRLDVELRAFDDGVAVRYSIPEQEGIAEFQLADEVTRLSFPGDPTAHVLPLKGYTTSYENYYETLRVSEVPPDMLLGVPMLLESATSEKEGETTSTWIGVTEAGLKDYAGMYLAPVPGKTGSLVSKLSPLPGRTDGVKVVGKAPFHSPWRVLMIADDPGRLLESNIVFNLNDSSAIDDTSWIKPGKTTFPWWNGYEVGDVDFEPGVNTATMKHYIDFCAEQGIPYHSLDGLDIAWYGGPIAPTGPTDVTQAAPSVDMPELLRYAKEKGVRLRLWMHWKALAPQLDEALAKYEEWGIEGIMIDFMDRDDQEMVAWYHEVAEKAAKHHLTVTWHGAYKPTGMERTWPNVLNYEAALNQEYNKWQPPGVKGTPPEHNLDIAFVRMLAGPLDYHQGGMRSVLPENYQWRDKAPPVQGTRGHQLAMYVIYQNHLPMMADYPNAYRGEAGLDFMVDVPTTWDEMRVLYAKFEKGLVIARRKGDAWYVGGMAAKEDLDLELPLDFLGEGSFDAKLILDDPANGPTAVVERTEVVSTDDKLKVNMPQSGGFVATLRPAE